MAKKSVRDKAKRREARLEIHTERETFPAKVSRPNEFTPPKEDIDKRVTGNAAARENAGKEPSVAALKKLAKMHPSKEFSDRMNKMIIKAQRKYPELVTKPDRKPRRSILR